MALHPVDGTCAVGRREAVVGRGAMPLEIRYEVELHPTPPFSFDGTVHKPSHFPSNDNAYETGSYWQTMRFAGKTFGIKMANRGSVDEPCIQLAVFTAEEMSEDEIQAISDEVAYRFDLQADLSEFYSDYADDDVLGPVLERWRGMRVMASASLYEFLVITTVLQNATVRRSVQMLENLFRRYGSEVAYDGKRLLAFWPAEAIGETSEEELRALKVGYRARQLKRQAEAFVSGQLDEFQLRALSTDELKPILLSIYGIGPASVWYLLFGVFKRYDALDYISPWEQKIYSRLLFDQELMDADVILRHAKSRWGKWRMLAVHTIFEDLFWQRKTQHVPWLEELIRL
jgi:3-methyladenine DNA glycosylase/8-oxoguanine DNA glycosylase